MACQNYFVKTEEKIQPIKYYSPVHNGVSITLFRPSERSRSYLNKLQQAAWDYNNSREYKFEEDMYLKMISAHPGKYESHERERTPPAGAITDFGKITDKDLAWFKSL